MDKAAHESAEETDRVFIQSGPLYLCASLSCLCQAASDLIQSLFVSTLEDEQLTSKAVRDIKNHKLPQDSPETSTLHPISPVDFTLSIKRDKSQSRSMKETQRWTEAETMKRSSMNRLPQTLVVQSLDQANAVIQAALLELIVTKELKVSNARYTLPKPFLLLIVLPQGFDSSTISAQLLDRVFVSYPIHEPSQPSNSTRTYTGRRTAHIKAEHLEDRASQVYINIDISRYIRDIVVGIRTHPLVKSGLTARASQELVLVTKSLAVIFGKEYLTPDLVSIAAEKVFGHRLRLTSPHLTPADVVAEILCLVYVPV
ncbi:hypothetical protein BDF14DRAFT_1117633 [Spinellus fusiger]|nr:hypothetical protein BDF14DRAFT_1117633 [Spinellus fusiger]